MRFSLADIGVSEPRALDQRPWTMPRDIGRANWLEHGAREGPMTNTLYYGDNLHVLREHIADESVDLVYLDPPSLPRLRRDSLTNAER